LGTLLSGCAYFSKPTPVATAPAPAAQPAPPTVAVAPAPVAPTIAPPSKVSAAVTPKDYRRDAASHIYELNGHRVFTGKMPPLLYAVGVLQVDIDARGNVTGLHWMRAPSQAPEVVAEIERSIRQASPFPAPVKMGHVTYTDTWLWHKSGRFQLDTLTEGQM
jgi:hypothetical protein